MITKERTFWLLKPESVPSKIGRSVICNKFTGFEQFCSVKDVGSGDDVGTGVGEVIAEEFVGDGVRDGVENGNGEGVGGGVGGGAEMIPFDFL